MEDTIVYYERWPNDKESMTSLRNKSAMLRSFKEKECPYFKSDALEMLNKLLEKRLIELTVSKRPKETNNPRYCTYHEIVSHPTKKCKAFRGQILQLVDKGKIILREEDTEESD